MTNAAMGGVQTGTTKLYESFWRARESNATRIVAISESLKQLAEGHNRTVTPRLLAGYTAVLEDLNQQEIILAFSRAHDEERYWPSPAGLRGLSGREPMGDPLEKEAEAALHVLLAKMRRHGWQLKPELGKIIATDGPDGRLLDEPKREPTTHANLPPRTLQAVGLMGWGDHKRGLAVLREHPGIANPPDMDAEYKVNVLKQADELQRRWIECYRQAGI